MGVEPEVKTCSKCKEEKPNTEFHKKPDTFDGLNKWCKPCRNGHKVEIKKYQAVWRNYRVDEETARWLYSQGCALCGKKTSLHIDHCHETGRVRGVLCSSHNMGLGKFGDGVEQLKKAIEYLEREDDFRARDYR